MKINVHEHKTIFLKVVCVVVKLGALLTLREQHALRLKTV